MSNMAPPAQTSLLHPGSLCALWAPLSLQAEQQLQQLSGLPLPISSSAHPQGLCTCCSLSLHLLSTYHFPKLPWTPSQGALLASFPLHPLKPILSICCDISSLRLCKHYLSPLTQHSTQHPTPTLHSGDPPPCPTAHC